ncbi:ABC transporter ATP-binding protein [Polymorphospora rubra]|uniref:Sugar ABC transporter ATP-binding protein n=1 Tax=Polymorphospora rubra TaxID=338584 RepID=A0A810N4B9_9ACTN|nr:ABC transporter ATP-binding protein [Polymorphospora rubra]BCJ66578.1 sugar ABC transporter ATP-binding protein [Polymorphospora rubra]
MVAIATDRLTKIFDDGTVAVDDVTIDVRSGEFMVLLGPTGCGKSTVLRLVAGLERPTSGQVRFDGRPVDDIEAGDRGIALVRQDHALYPHLTVAQNIGFPLRSGGDPGPEATGRITEMAEQLGIVDVLHRLPGNLSGGQRQRVAIARALARRPAAFLLDEPLSHLDAGMRADLRADLTALARRNGTTTIYVTHDQVEAMSMADRVAVLRRGVLQQIGPPAQVYGDPATVFVAAFLGSPRANLFQCAVYAGDGRVVLDLGTQVIDFPPDEPRSALLAGRHTERATVALRADALRPAPADADGPVLHGVVRAVENLGHEVLVHLETGGVPTSPAESRLELPDSVRPLSGLLAEPERPARGGRWPGLGRLIPRQRAGGRPTARTRYGFYPVYDPELPDDQSTTGDLVVRVPVPATPRIGDRMTVSVDLDLLLLFDRAGDRIRL